ncbi:hypothetical protein NLJ89_g9921 [Agrocybe chaxingu]|uniref:DNA-directed RNA polymerase III subunit n=1 Tax=Agrocybe chaxingu TaxID=84603 RepID=A0A9W8JPT3_9AGAR|nr:hypothetical protein NLJ89_g9921 [Agrocybe chaxingu]
MGLTFADLQNLSREATALYPPRELPIFTEPTHEEKRIAELQLAYAARMRKSEYYVTEKPKTTELERYSDKYRPSVAARPELQRDRLHQPFFPAEVFDGYFYPKRRKKKISRRSTGKPKLNLDALGDEVDEGEKSDGERSEAGSQEAPDYDVDEEYDNDYAENYFDNGEGDDMDDLGDGRGGDDGGGGGDYD